MAYRPASLKVRALQWLAQREHSPAEMRVKLLRAAAGQVVPAAAVAADVHASLITDGEALLGGQADDEATSDGGAAGQRRRAATAEDVAEVDALIDWLSSHGYLSSERFVESRIHARQSRYGNQRITRELQQHGLRLAPEAQQALKGTELARARDVWSRKFGSAAADPAERLRQMRFLAGRGFSHEVVRRVVRAGTGADEDD